jgi:putative transposase
MDGSIRLSEEERKVLLQAYRSGSCVRVARRAQIVLLLADGWSYREVREATFASYDLIKDCLERIRADGIRAVLETSESRQPPPWWRRVVAWLTKSQPEDFGYYRARWSCAMLAEVLAWETGVRRSAETIRRALRQSNWVWRRPRPVVGLADADYDEKMQRIRDLLANLPADETAVFEDEVDVHLNPKIGSCWMQRGQQAEVRTPGNNEKQHVAGSLHWRTGSLVVSSPGRSRDSRLFISHLEHLRRRLRSYWMINVICDNAAFHRSRQVQAYLARWAHRLKVHFLPKYAPETNPIERVWWHFHETVTRNHRCQSLAELLRRAYEWFQAQGGFYSEMNRILSCAA